MTVTSVYDLVKVLCTGHRVETLMLPCWSCMLRVDLALCKYSILLLSRISFIFYFLRACVMVLQCLVIYGSLLLSTLHRHCLQKSADDTDLVLSGQKNTDMQLNLAV